MSQAVPFLFSAGGSIIQGQQAKRASRYNASILDQEGRSADQQTAVAETQQRHQGRDALGREAAASAQSGTGPGSSTDLMDESAVNAELDALNVRYRGQLTKYGLSTQATLTRRAGDMAEINSFLNAGGQVLRARAAYGGG